MNNPRRFCAILLVLAGSLLPANALVVYGDTEDDPTYRTDPGLGSIWNSVAAVSKPSEDFNGSAVYLGNNTFLTAGHVNPFSGSEVKINGTIYSLDTSFYGTGYVNVGNLDGVTDNPDMKLFRIVATSIDLTPAVLNTNTSEDVSKTSVIIGFGKGKGTEVVDKGWNWGAESTAMQRWGASVSYNFETISYSGYTYKALGTPFFVPFGDFVASGAQGDSGGALFQNINGVWVLSGLTTLVSVNGSSYYDRSDDAGPQPDWTYYVRISQYADKLQQAIPEPSSVILVTLALGVAAAWGVTKRRNN